jgi:hypothetical protein
MREGAFLKLPSGSRVCGGSGPAQPSLCPCCGRAVAKWRTSLLNPHGAQLGTAQARSEVGRRPTASSPEGASGRSGYCVLAFARSLIFEAKSITWKV